MSDPDNLERQAVPFNLLRDDEEQPLDEELDDDAVDSAEADERAAREGTKGDDDTPQMTSL